MGATSYKHPTLLDWPARKPGIARKCIFVFIALTPLIVFSYYTQFDMHNVEEVILNDSKSRPQNDVHKYLIHTSKCRIPDDDPFNEEGKKFYHKEDYIKCSKKPLLTYVEKKDSFFTLYVNQSLLQTYSTFEISCCYSNVTRIVEQNKSDDQVRFSACLPFKKSINVTSPVILVKCINSLNYAVYANVHNILNPDLVVKKKIQDWSGQVPFSVIFVGIDSVSKMNLVRTMPKSYKFLEEHDFLNLKGYTKIGDNTFPNLMAILSGKLTDQINDHCHPKKKKLNNCDIIWDKFSQLGYITAYGEDESSISTFHYGRQGFDQPPTDFYLRPYIITAEKLPSIKKFSMHYCSGPENSGERIMNVAKDFLLNFKDRPKFGFFWMNTFSHDNLNLPSSMDDRIESFLEETYSHMNNTIFIFFSDHGFRFGEFRYTHTGWLEERLPFIYIHIPKTFKKRYSKEYNNFLTNTKRLTTPFDLYMTLQDILFFANQSYSVQPSLGCPKCHSLFKEVSETRTCQDASIEQHWCMCSGHSYINPQRKIAVDTGNFIVSELNNIFKRSEEGNKCAHYMLKKVTSAGMSEEYLNERNESVNFLLIMLETRPPAMFEATVEVNTKSYDSPTFRLLGDISRTNRYGDNGKCIKGSMQKYCYCDGLLTSIKSAICNFLNCL